jgi:two-component system, OmpR family, phosphate regulon response regulator PhoB
VTSFLIVEDDPDTQVILHDYLGTLGGDVRVAGTAEEARQLLAESQPSLVLIDVGLPDGDGVSLLAEMRAREGLASTRTIGMTAYSDRATRERVLAAGFDEVLWKPVDGQDLLRAVRRVIAAT